MNLLKLDISKQLENVTPPIPARRTAGGLPFPHSGGFAEAKNKGRSEEGLFSQIPPPLREGAEGEGEE